LLFNPSPAIEAASLIEKETEFSYERRRWPEKRPVESNKKLTGIDSPFSDRINRIGKYESKINPDNPVNPV
jgi:hypothetical protein